MPDQTAAVPVGLADTTTNIADGSTTPAGTLVLLWVADTLPLYLDAVYAYETDADLCDGCPAYMLEGVGGTRQCGTPVRYCPACWTDAPHYCGHPEHW